MPEVVNGLTVDPTYLLEAAFQSIADTTMRALPFYQPQIPVKACKFQLYEHQWLGGMLTPWMLSLLVLPGPDQCWEKRAIGQKLALSLPCGNVRFMVGEMEGIGQYLACSLMSPLERHLTAPQLITAAEQTVQMALALPVRNTSEPVNPSRRALFSRGTGHA